VKINHVIRSVRQRSQWISALRAVSKPAPLREMLISRMLAQLRTEAIWSPRPWTRAADRFYRD